MHGRTSFEDFEDVELFRARFKEGQNLQNPGQGLPGPVQNRQNPQNLQNFIKIKNF